MPTRTHTHTIGVTRRELLQVGYSGLLGIGLGAPAASNPGSGGFGRAKSLILVFLTGGPSHLEMFDPKPEAPSDVRGEFKPLETRVSGIRYAEHLPRLAALADRLTVIRSMAHRNNGHLPATHWVLTGRPMPNLPIDSGADKIRSRTDWPSYGSTMSYFRPRTDGVPGGVNLPTYLQEPPLLWPGQYAGCMGPHYDPWQIRDDPNREGFRVENLSLAAGFAMERMHSRSALLRAVNRAQDGLSGLAEMQTLTRQQHSAFSLLTASRFGEAFRLDREPAGVRDAYGRHQFGQSLLLARRLVEAGVRVVQANMGHVQTWDSHPNIFPRLRNELLPPLDRGVSALLQDLEQRGLLDETLVVVTGEFGRTPRINKDGGRDHWADCFSVAVAGAGVRGGQVIGASDATGSYPAEEPYTPDDLGATIYHALGIRPDSEFRDVESRPQVLNSGTVISRLYA